MQKTILHFISGFISLFIITSCEPSLKIFQEDANDWEIKGDANWSFSNNELIGEVHQGDGFVITKQQFKNFVLELEFNPDSSINSGVFIRCSKEKINPIDCYELNIWDLHPDQNNRTGAIVNRSVPLEKVKTINKWNSYKIKVEETHLQVWINNILVNDTNDENLQEGYIGLQAKGTGKISFRNIKIEELK